MDEKERDITRKEMERNITRKRRMVLRTLLDDNFESRQEKWDFISRMEVEVMESIEELLRDYSSEMDKKKYELERNYLNGLKQRRRKRMSKNAAVVKKTAAIANDEPQA